MELELFGEAKMKGYAGFQGFIIGRGEMIESKKPVKKVQEDFRAMGYNVLFFEGNYALHTLCMTKWEENDYIGLLAVRDKANKVDIDKICSHYGFSDFYEEQYAEIALYRFVNSLAHMRFRSHDNELQYRFQYGYDKGKHNTMTMQIGTVYLWKGRLIG